jgi:hypothetical protein
MRSARWHPASTQSNPHGSENSCHVLVARCMPAVMFTRPSGLDSVETSVTIGLKCAVIQMHLTCVHIAHLVGIIGGVACPLSRCVLRDML